MDNPPPPPAPVQKKSGMGCLGCGCLILVLLAVLFLALVGGTGYYLYALGLGYTSPQPVAIQTFDGGQDMYTATEQKITAFRELMRQHHPASLHLNSDEINTLIARDPAYVMAKDHVIVTLKDNQAEIQTGIPIGTIEKWAYADRFLNLDTTFTVSIDQDEKNIHFHFQKIHVNDQDFSQSFYDSFNGTFSSSFNQQLKKSASIKDFLDQTQKFTVENSELVIEMQ